jgi:hypothetical protein
LAKSGPGQLSPLPRLFSQHAVPGKLPAPAPPMQFFTHPVLRKLPAPHPPLGNVPCTQCPKNCLAHPPRQLSTHWVPRKLPRIAGGRCLAPNWRNCLFGSGASNCPLWLGNALHVATCCNTHKMLVDVCCVQSCVQEELGKTSLTFANP